MRSLPTMARGIGENPARSPAAHLQAVEYPATREDIVQTAGDNEAPAEVINFLKSLPKDRYDSYEEALPETVVAARTSARPPSSRRTRRPITPDALLRLADLAGRLADFAGRRVGLGRGLLDLRRNIGSEGSARRRGERETGRHVGDREREEQ